MSDKKPSERIKELLDIKCAFPKGTVSTWADFVECIVEYLDEQWEEPQNAKEKS